MISMSRMTPTRDAMYARLDLNLKKKRLDQPTAQAGFYTTRLGANEVPGRTHSRGMPFGDVTKSRTKSCERGENAWVLG